MENQENSKIIENLTLLGNRVLIQLHEQREVTSKDGILIPLSDITVTESGRLKTTPSSKTFLSKGTVLLTSPQVTSVQQGQQVYVSESAVTPQYQFFLNRNQLVNQFEGIISIPEALIEAIYKNEA